MPLQGKPLLYTISCLTALSFCLMGYDNGVIGGLTEDPSFKAAFNHPSPSALSTIVAVYEIGCFLGAILTAFIGENLGRKRCLTLGSSIMFFGAIGQASAFSRAQIIVFRIISGLGMGLINSTAPVLQAEVSPRVSRGRFVCAQMSTLNLGIFLAYWIDFACTQHSRTSFAFRFPIAFQLVIIIPIFILSLVVTESPRWLANHGRTAEATDVISKLLGRSTDDIVVEKTMQEIMESIYYERSIQTGQWQSLWTHDNLQSRKRLLMACTIQFCQQLGGINGIVYFAGLVFASSLGFDNYMGSLMSGFMFTFFFIASFIPWFLIDTIGRKPLLIGSTATMAVIFGCMSGLVKQIEIEASNARACGIAAAVLAFLYFGAFTTGFQATVWVYPAEILPLRIRAKGTALATSTKWITNFAVVQIFPILINRIGWKTYIVFGLFNACFPILFSFFTETKGRSLEEIDLLFMKGVAGDDLVEKVESPLSEIALEETKLV